MMTTTRRTRSGKRPIKNLGNKNAGLYLFIFARQWWSNSIFVRAAVPRQEIAPAEPDPNEFGWSEATCTFAVDALFESRVDDEQNDWRFATWQLKRDRKSYVLVLSQRDEGVLHLFTPKLVQRKTRVVLEYSTLQKRSAAHADFRREHTIDYPEETAPGDLVNEWF